MHPGLHRILHQQLRITMPLRKASIKRGTRQVLKNTAYVLEVAAWLLHDGWEVYQPFLDNGHCTDLLMSDGLNFHRIQIKTVAVKK